MMSDPIIADYIIVGAGSAGCVLANRLSADPANKVLLLEAGGDDRPLHNLKQFWSNMLIHTPIGFGKTLNDPKVNWIYETEPDPGTGGRPHKWPKGKVLGGSSSINGMLYIRGQAADYDGWAQMGARAGPRTTCCPISAARRTRSAASASSHGVGGPLEHLRLPGAQPVSQALLEACVEAGIPYSPDINAREQEGVSWFQLTEQGRQALLGRGRLSSTRRWAAPICRSSREAHDHARSCSKASAPSASSSCRTARRKVARSQCRGDPRRRRGRFAASCSRSRASAAAAAAGARRPGRSTNPPASARICRTTI